MIKTNTESLSNAYRSNSSEIHLIIFLCLLMGIDKYYASKLPFEFFRGIPLVFFLCAGFILLKYRSIEWVSNFNKILFSLIIYGIILGTCRYLWIYQNKGYTWIPILRHSVALFMGLMMFIGFRKILGKVSFYLISQCLLLSSIPFLFIGLYQYLTNHMVGYFPRAVSLFTEPSYYADYLVLLLAPSLIYLLTQIERLNAKHKTFLLFYTSLWFVNILATQSGTGLLKLLTLLMITFFYYPIKFKIKVYSGIVIAVLLALGLGLKRGYVIALFEYALEVIQNPEMFFHHHTFYDRFFPIYAAFKNLFSFSGVVGLGFGGDYFEMKNLFPPSTHAVMIAAKPTLSYFNSFSSKIILYFGLPGLIWLISIFKLSLKNNQQFIKTGTINVLISAFWGVSNFALPYLWFWLALTAIQNTPSDDLKVKNL